MKRQRPQWTQETVDLITKSLLEERFLSEEEFDEIAKREGKSRRAIASQVYSIKKQLIRQNKIKK